jgi:hypothetical protein
MTVLSSELRSALERAIVAARDAAEAASRVALDVLGVDAERVSDHLHEDERGLRVALRAEARVLGGFERLVEECAYEQWHRMMFARFLAENELLIHPEHGVAVSLADCEEIAHDRGLADLWVVASDFAAAMLPGIFRPDDPALRLRLAPEGQQALEEILGGLPSDVFTSDDGLGWVYQYWQAKKKQEVNASERKIGGADIAPVTQLFTEHYMVRFLLENTLGAWWVARHPRSAVAEEWEYLRFDDEGKPAAGSFHEWPEAAAEVTVMDPCCGSGHFLVTAFEMLRRMRMEAERLSPADAGDAVLRDNLFGLELDARCTQIAAFALALQAWKTGGYRELPVPNVACSGISAAGRSEDWKRLAGGDQRLETSLGRLHALFADAADLGSLVDPLRESDGDLLAAQFDEVEPLFGRAIEAESASDPSLTVFGHLAANLARAGTLLAGRYVLVTTNPPFLSRTKQADVLRKFADRNYPNGRADLSTMFIERCDGLTVDGGTFAIVTPQNWLELGSYRRLREEFLVSRSAIAAVWLGEEAWESFGIRGPRTVLAIVARTRPPETHVSLVLDASARPGKSQVLLPEKLVILREGEMATIPQRAWLTNPDARITSRIADVRTRLELYASSLLGLHVGDFARFRRAFWEVSGHREWRFLQSSVSTSAPYAGRESVLRWVSGGREHFDNPSAYVRGGNAWGRSGVVVTLMRELPVTVYTGELFDNNVAVILPNEEVPLPALWCFLSSDEFNIEVRRLDSKVNVTNGTLLGVPFDVERWRKVAEQDLSEGLPTPRTVDPTQWLFDGYPRGAAAPLQVAVARLVGYRWPRQTGSEFMDFPGLSADGLDAFADDDGIVCVPGVRAERPAAERLRALLAVVFEEKWSPAREADLLTEVGYSGKSLERWLREGFFEQHCQVFHQRPFVWHVWDGRKDGFAALLNYHRLDRTTLEKLAYTYLGDWIGQQRADVQGGIAGSELRLAAAEELQRKLARILEGESPCDVFVRWKPIEGQPIGWDPDLNDGVRLNIRPFVTAGALRKNPKLNWNKDRGKDPESAPWGRAFRGNRINDHHLTLAEKRAAREAASRRSDA